jgi:hypothetical protein
VGWNYGNISNCYSTGNATGGNNSSELGGLVGSNGATISDCYSTGAVSGGSSSYSVGGLVGENDSGSISNCYSTGSVSGDTYSSYAYVGGLVGYHYTGSISNCYSTGMVSNNVFYSSYVGGLVGYSINSSIGNCYFLITSGPDNGYGIPLTDEQMKQQSNFIGWDFDGDPPIWKIQENITYPHLFWEPNAVTPPQPQYTGGTGTTEDPYQISNVADLQLLMASPADWDKYFIQTADINMQGIEMTPVGNDVNNFIGSFDGQSHIISNIYINMPGSNNVGLFGYVGSGGQIRNLGVENVNITGHNNVGGLVGYSYGSISNCYSTGLVSSDAYSSYVGGLVGWDDSGSITNCYSTGTITGGDDSEYLGGLVGQFGYGYISNCYSTGTVTGGDYSYLLGGLVGINYDGSISDCYSTGVVTGGDNSYYLGGLVGYSESRNNISNCYSTSAVTGGIYSHYLGGLVGYNFDGSISNCYSTGAVSGSSGSSAIGGLVGYNYYSSISNCYFLITSGPNDGNGTPLTNEQMKQQSSFVDWDFTTIWRMRCEGMNYPKLNWQVIPAADLVCPDGVDFADYSFFAERWLNTDCASSNNCDGADLDLSGTVDIADLAILCNHWLKGF